MTDLKVVVLNGGTGLIGGSRPIPFTWEENQHGDNRRGNDLPSGH
jgi:hypothetical protein